MNRVAGLVLHYLDAERSARCVASMLEQSVAPVLVWDNSADGGLSARRLLQLLGNDERILLRGGDANLGFAAGVNRGLAAIREAGQVDAILLLNNDAVLLEGAVAALSACAEAHPEAPIVYPQIDHGGQVRGTVHHQRWSGLLTASPLPGSHPYASGCCLFIAHWPAGARLLDEDFFMYGEDVELGWRLQCEGRPAQLLPEPLVFHEGSASSGMASTFYESRMVAAHLLLARKLATSPLEAKMFLAVRAVFLPVRALIRAVRYRSLQPVKALWVGLQLTRSLHDG